MPMTQARLERELRDLTVNHDGEVTVAVLEGIPVAYGTFGRAWWSGQGGFYQVDIRVAQKCEGQGIGGSLYRQMLLRLQERGGTKILSKVREDSARGIAFAKRYGFVASGEVIEDYVLRLEDAPFEPLPARIQRLSELGIRIVRLSELEWHDISLLRCLHLMWADLPTDSSYDSDLESGFEVWKQQVIEGDGVCPDTFWVAMLGETPVGMTFLRKITDVASENDFTGVAMNYRGHGIAYTLKLRAIEWAQQSGITYFYTSSEVNNRAMIVTNTRLGYRAGARRRELTSTRFAV